MKSAKTHPNAECRMKQRLPRLGGVRRCKLLRARTPALRAQSPRISGGAGGEPATPDGSSSRFERDFQTERGRHRTEAGQTRVSLAGEKPIQTLPV